MAKMTPDQFADKLISNLKSASKYIADGVNKTDKDPIENAKAAYARWQDGIQEAIAKDKWRKGLDSSSKAHWQKRMTEVGIGRIAAGLDSARPTIQEFGSQLLSYQDSIKGNLDKIKSTGFQRSLDRATQWITDMHNFTYTRPKRTS